LYDGTAAFAVTATTAVAFLPLAVWPAGIASAIFPIIVYAAFVFVVSRVDRGRRITKVVARFRELQQQQALNIKPVRAPKPAPKPKTKPATANASETAPKPFTEPVTTVRDRHAEELDAYERTLGN
jgi:hypothetical protein